MPKIITLKIWGDEGLAVVDTFPPNKTCYGLFSWVDEKNFGHFENLVLRPVSETHPNPEWKRYRDFGYKSEGNRKPRRHIFIKSEWFEYMPKIFMDLCEKSLGEVPKEFKTDVFVGSVKEKVDTDFADKHGVLPE